MTISVTKKHISSFSKIHNKNKKGRGEVQWLQFTENHRYSLQKDMSKVEKLQTYEHLLLVAYLCYRKSFFMVLGKKFLRACQIVSADTNSFCKRNYFTSFQEENIHCIQYTSEVVDCTSVYTCVFLISRERLGQQV